MIERLKNGETTANFFEGMACNGGCVGGPKAIVGRDEGRKNIDQYAETADYKTPLENPFVMELLSRLGFKTIDEFLEKSDLFVREF